MAAVSVRVEQQTKQDEPGFYSIQTGRTVPGKYHFEKTQKRTLKIFLTSSAKEDTTVKINYTYFGHASGGHEVVPIDQGEKAATLKPGVTQEVDAPTSTQTYMEEHDVGRGSSVKIPASGNKLTGYGVQVFVGDKLMGENYEPPSMKDLMGKAPVAPKK
jgi:hypothetical protein